MILYHMVTKCDLHHWMMTKSDLTRISLNVDYLFLSMLWWNHCNNHPQENLTKFGYKMVYKKFQIYTFNFLAVYNIRFKILKKWRQGKPLKLFFHIFSWFKIMAQLLNIHICNIYTSFRIHLFCDWILAMLLKGIYSTMCKIITKPIIKVL
jgi:hypothetical protein